MRWCFILLYQFDRFLGIQYVLVSLKNDEYVDCGGRSVIGVFCSSIASRIYIAVLYQYDRTEEQM